jgi:DNA-binding MarR family transcriptional regulator
MPLRRDWPNVILSHVARVLLVLLKAEKEGRALTVTQLINDSGIQSSTFYATLRRALEEGKLIAFEVDREHRVIYVKLTERGRKLAMCLEEIGIGKDLGASEGPEEEG